MKLSIPLEGLSATQLKCYAAGCGWILAPAHAKSGDTVVISGYLGKSEVFDQVRGQFAITYASQNEKDHAA